MFNWLFEGKKTAAERREGMLSAYIDGELSSREQADLEGALAKDSALRAELAALRHVVGMMGEVPQVRVPRSFTLDPAVFGQVKQPRFQLYPALRVATVLATVVLVFLFAGDLFIGLGGGAAMPAQTVPEQQLAEVREAEEVVVESRAVEVTLEVEAPAAKLAEDAVPQELAAPAAEIESEATGRVVGTQAATAEYPAEPIEPPAAAPQAEEAVVEEPAEIPSAEGPMMLAIPGTLTAEGEAVADSGVPETGVATPAPEATVEAYGVEAPGEASEMAPETVDEEVAPWAGEEVSTGVNWLLIIEISLGVLVASLLVVTLLARHYGW